MCGEKAPNVIQSIADYGSPPRVRGKAMQFMQRVKQLGITPACAGKRCSALLPAGAAQDHPRVCGEKSIRFTHDELQQGSPPRVRGKVGNRGTGGLKVRITPACAGKRHTASGALCLGRDHPRVCGEKLLLLQPLFPCAGSPPRVRGKD